VHDMCRQQLFCNFTNNDDNNFSENWAPNLHNAPRRQQQTLFRFYITTKTYLSTSCWVGAPVTLAVYQVKLGEVSSFDIETLQFLNWKTVK
jgi:hypothetical protein